jgi:hypothetical protein
VACSRSSASCVACKDLYENQHDLRRPGSIVSRSSIGIKEDIAILQILSFGTGSQMLLKGVAALDWRDGGFVDFRVLLGFVSHIELVGSCNGVQWETAVRCEEES